MRSLSGTRMDPKFTLQKIQAFMDIKKAEAPGFIRMGMDRGGVKSGSIIGHGDTNIIIGFLDGDTHFTGMGMLNDIDKHLLNSPEQDGLYILRKRFRGIVVMKFGAEMVLPPELIDQGLHGGFESQFIEDGRTEIEGQRPGILDGLIEKRPNFIDRFLKISGPGNFGEETHFYFGKGQGLTDMVMEIGGDPATFMLLGLGDLGGQRTEAFLIAEKFFPGPFAFNGISNGAEEKVLIDLSLDKIILGALTDGLDGEIFIDQSGQNDNGHVGNPGLKGKKTVQPGTIRQGQVQQDDIKMILLTQFQSVGDTFATGQFHAKGPHLLHDAPKEFDIPRIIFHQQNGNGIFHHSFSVPLPVFSVFTSGLSDIASRVIQEF